jgi:hypothetical protein
MGSAPVRQAIVINQKAGVDTIHHGPLRGISIIIYSIIGNAAGGAERGA